MYVQITYCRTVHTITIVAATPSDVCMDATAAAAARTSPTAPSPQQQQQQSCAGATDYLIAIPSHDRPETLKSCTLRALEKAKVNCGSEVHIFVTSNHEAERYKSTLTPGSYRSITVGAPPSDGIGRARDFILDHFDVGSKVVMLDDDIEHFVQKYDGDLDLRKVIVTGFQLCKEKGTYMWGLNTSRNQFFMRKTYSVGWCFIQGPFMAFRVRDGIRLDPNQQNEVCEDVQYSLLHCEVDGRVLRVNGVGVKVRPYNKEPGGLQSVYSEGQRAEMAKKNRAWLLSRYGRFISEWLDSKPHPRLRQSPEHAVTAVEL